MNRNISTFLMVVFFSVFTFAQNNSWKQATSGGYTYKYVTGDPTNSRFYTLKNGLTVILSPTPKEPRIQAFVAVKAGSKTDPATHTGLAHYLEHMLFKGTDKYGTQDWAKEKPELDEIEALYEKYNSTKDEKERTSIYHQIDSISGVASHYAIANEYDKMMTAMGAQGTNAWTSFEETVYTDDIPSASLDKYLTVQSERFRNPVLRLFHTELEAVYEEKNRSLDSDGSRVFETLLANLFKKHNYGLQTTIGTVEHLKNPSLVEIKKYFNKYYVPNNVGLILSGDFNPDQVIANIDKYFSKWQPRRVSPYTFTQEEPITKPITKEVVGPDPESVVVGFRLPGNKNKDILLADLVGSILTNGSAGLIDLNLVKQQKLLTAGAFTFALNDYGVLYLYGAPKAGQSLEQVKELIINEIDNLKKGNFDDDLISSIVNNTKKDILQQFESYSGRARALVGAFTSEKDWLQQVSYVNNLSKVTKADVVAFANKYLGDNNYVVIYKRKGKRQNIKKIQKPKITPVQTNADKQSAFVKMVQNMPSTPTEPLFLDYSKDLQKNQLGKAEVLSVQNKDNELYRLRFRYKIGYLNDLKLPIAAQYIKLLGTDKKSAEAVSKEFYKIASSFSISVGDDYTMVTIEGLQENFDKALRLYEDLVLNVKADQTALSNLIARIKKSRIDAKSNKERILSGLTNYAVYGPENKFNYVLTDNELNAITATELINKIKDLNNYEQSVLYYGPLTASQLMKEIKKAHQVSNAFKQPAAAKKFVQVSQTKNQVLFTDYDMVQAETNWVHNGEVYNPNQTALVEMFNSYFGGGMGSLVFQTIRESKALAYSTYGYYMSPSKKEDRYYMIGYVGSQADKFDEAVSAMNELLNTMPELPGNFALAKEQVKKDIQTERITQDGIIFNYLASQKLGLKEDIRKQVYQNLDKVTLNDLKAFHQKNIAGKPYTYVIVASDKKVSLEQMKKIGDVKKVTLEELFGY